LPGEVAKSQEALFEFCYLNSFAYVQCSLTGLPLSFIETLTPIAVEHSSSRSVNFSGKMVSLFTVTLFADIPCVGLNFNIDIGKWELLSLLLFNVHRNFIVTTYNVGLPPQWTLVYSRP
jgi:hypothetical protein